MASSAAVGLRMTRYSRGFGVGALVTWSMAAFTACVITPPSVNQGLRVRATCPTLDDPEYYFEAGTLGRYDQSNRPGFSALLRAAGERSLSCGREAPDARRLTYAPNTARGNVIIAIDCEGSQCTLRATEFAPSPDRLTVVRTGTASVRRDREQDAVAASLDRFNVWEADVWQGRSGADDGDNWLLEVRSGNRYRAIGRHVPDDDLFTEVARQFFIAAKLAPPQSVSDLGRAR